MEAISEGKHVLVEKPLGRRFEDVKCLLDLKYDKVVMTGFSLRYHRMYIDLYNLIKELGNPLLAIHVALGNIPQVKWICDTEVSGGLFNENAVHIIYLFRWYLGEIRSVFGKIYSASREGMEDNVVAVFNHDTGATSSIMRSWTAGQIVRYYDFTFTNASIHLNGYLNGELTIVRGGEKTRKSYPRIFEEMYYEEMKHFIECIEYKKTPYTTLRDGIVIQAIVDAVRESSISGKNVNISSIVGGVI